jgi:hypothetical protein
MCVLLPLGQQCVSFITLVPLQQCAQGPRVNRRARCVCLHTVLHAAFACMPGSVLHGCSVCTVRMDVYAFKRYCVDGSTCQHAVRTSHRGNTAAVCVLSAWTHMHLSALVWMAPTATCQQAVARLHRHFHVVLAQCSHQFGYVCCIQY